MNRLGGQSFLHRFKNLPFLLYSYVAAELLAPFFASFVILYGIFFLVQLVPLLEVVLALRIGLADFIRLSSYLFPHMLLYIIPMASMAGVIMGFSRLANDREILALKACGVSLRRMLPPVLIFAALIATLTGYFSIRLIPLGELGIKQLMFQLAKDKIDKGLKEKEFTEALGDLVVYVDEIDQNQNWHGVYVSDMRGRYQPLITMAQSGHLTPDVDHMQVVVVLENGTLRNVDGQDNQVLHFKRYQLQIPLRPPGAKDLGDLSRGSMTQHQLLEAAKKVGRKTKEGLSYRSEYYHRLSMPIGCFILSIIGLPLALQAGPGRRAIGIPLGLTVFIFYYISFTMARFLGEDGKIPLVLGMWLPNIIFFGFALYFLWRVDQERPLLPEKIHTGVLAIHSRWVAPVFGWIGKKIKQLAFVLFGAKGRNASSKETAGLLVHANAHTRTFHFPECVQYNGPQCRIEFKDVKVAQEAGFHPCGFCATLLNKRDE